MLRQDKNIGVCDVIQFVDNAWGEKFKRAQVSGENMDTCKINLNATPPTLHFMNTQFVGTIIVEPSSLVPFSSSSSSTNDHKHKRKIQTKDKSNTNVDYLSTVILSGKRHEKIQIIGQTNRIIEFDVKKN